MNTEFIKLLYAIVDPPKWWQKLTVDSQLFTVMEQNIFVSCRRSSTIPLTHFYSYMWNLWCNRMKWILMKNEKRWKGTHKYEKCGKYLIEHLLGVAFYFDDPMHKYFTITYWFKNKFKTWGIQIWRLPNLEKYSSFSILLTHDELYNKCIQDHILHLMSFQCSIKFLYFLLLSCSHSWYDPMLQYWGSCVMQGHKNVVWWILLIFPLAIFVYYVNWDIKVGIDPVLLVTGLEWMKEKGHKKSISSGKTINVYVWKYGKNFSVQESMWFYCEMKEISRNQNFA